MKKVQQTLNDRKRNYGDFTEHSKVVQCLKINMRHCDGWERLSMAQRESLEMIVHKIGRILCGDPNYSDSWHDIAGYALRIDEVLNA